MICIAPFVSYYQSYQRTSPCCERYNDWDVYDWDTYVEKTKPLREMMLNDDYDSLSDDCKACLEGGKITAIELREAGLDAQVELAIERDSPVITHLSLGTSSKCNMACRTCSSSVSSERLKVTEKLGITEWRESLPDYDENFIATFENELDIIKNNIDTLQEVTFHGGDPIQNTRTEESLRYLLKAKDRVEIVFFSNGTFNTLPSGQGLIELLDEFKRVHYIFSMDSHPTINDYLRLKGNSKRCTKLVKEAREKLHERHMVYIHSAVSNYSILHYKDFYEWFTGEFEGVSFSYNIVSHPPHYAPHNLPEDQKRLVIKGLTEMPNADIKQDLMRSLFKKPYDESEWQKALHIDSLINESLRLGSANILLTGDNL